MFECFISLIYTCWGTIFSFSICIASSYSLGWGGSTNFILHLNGLKVFMSQLHQKTYDLTKVRFRNRVYRHELASSMRDAATLTPVIR